MRQWSRISMINEVIHLWYLFLGWPLGDLGHGGSSTNPGNMRSKAGIRHGWEPHTHSHLLELLYFAKHMILYWYKNADIEHYSIYAKEHHTKSTPTINSSILIHPEPDEAPWSTQRTQKLCAHIPINNK